MDTPPSLNTVGPGSARTDPGKGRETIDPFVVRLTFFPSLRLTRWPCGICSSGTAQ